MAKSEYGAFTHRKPQHNNMRKSAYQSNKEGSALSQSPKRRVFSPNNNLSPIENRNGH